MKRWFLQIRSLTIVCFFLLVFFLVFYIKDKDSFFSPTSPEPLSDPSEKEAFEVIYEKKLWGEGSGIGSSPKFAVPYLKLLEDYLNQPDIHSIIDLGCGDWALLSTLSIPDNKSYVGYDLVGNVIARNQKRYGKNNVKFVEIDALEDMKTIQGDLLIVKDVLHHWPNRQINYFLRNILPNFKYALLVNDFNLYASNQDIHFGGFRPINLKKEPFFQLNELNLLFDYPSHGITKRIYLYQRNSPSSAVTSEH